MGGKCDVLRRHKHLVNHVYSSAKLLKSDLHQESGTGYIALYSGHSDS